MVIPGDYRIGATLLGVAAFLGFGCGLWTQFLVHGVLGGFLSFQASRVRFRFSGSDLDVVFIEPGPDDAAAAAADTASSGDNKLQGGGANKWALSSITHWEFWWPGFPVLVYYKEKQTRPEGAPPRRRAAAEHAAMRLRGTRADARIPHRRIGTRVQASRTSSLSSWTASGCTRRCWRACRRP